MIGPLARPVEVRAESPSQHRSGGTAQTTLIPPRNGSQSRRPHPAKIILRQWRGVKFGAGTPRLHSFSRELDPKLM